MTTGWLKYWHLKKRGDNPHNQEGFPSPSSTYGHMFRKLHIQGDSGGICITLGNDSMSDSKQKSSSEHGSDFERLRSYGHFLIPVHALM
jgi:hypothetical protein